MNLEVNNILNQKLILYLYSVVMIFVFIV